MDSKSLLNKAVDKYIKKNGKLNIKTFADDNGFNYSTVYNAFHHRQTPSCENWMQIMKCLGAVKEYKNGIRISV